MTTAAGICSVLVGLAGVAVGVAIRRGSIRHRVGEFWNAGEFRFIRNAPFVMIPVGISLTMIGMLLLLGIDPEGGDIVPLGTALVGCVLIAVLGLSSLMTFLVQRDPPEWIKPDWVRREELRRGPAPGTTRRSEVVATWVGIAFSVLFAIGFGVGAIAIAVGMALGISPQ